MGINKRCGLKKIERGYYRRTAENGEVLEYWSIDRRWIWRGETHVEDPKNGFKSVYEFIEKVIDPLQLWRFRKKKKVVIRPARRASAQPNLELEVIDWGDTG